LTAFKFRMSSDSNPITIEDYRRLARKALPSMIWSFVEYGAEDLVTLAANRNAFNRYVLKSRVLTGKEPRKISVRIAGESLSLPVILSPTGLAGLSHWTGELGAAQAAERAGTLSILSTTGSYSIEEVSAGTAKDHFFQLYPWSDPSRGRHDLTLSLIERARRAGYKALFVTVDVQTHGNREAERRNGMVNPPILTPKRIIDGARRPKWWTALVRHKRFSSRTVEPAVGARAAVRSIDLHYRMMRAELSWTDFSWVREHWNGPLFIKGVLDADDAQHAVDLGADGVVVSNHGGRQLDYAVASLDALPAISARIGGRAQILLDGGVRRGSDVVKALCLGADAVCVGRPYLYGAAVNGPAGVFGVLEILRDEIIRVMTLMGVEDLRELDHSWLMSANTPVTGSNPSAQP
jgi:isopentenyl diphosphate isomerase/L-lactate dehydrogenase-like FMN-dependent dehydrogenase